MTGAERTAARAADRAVRRLSMRVADAAAARGIAAEAGADGVRLSGPGLKARMADDAALRWIAGWLR